MQLNITYCIDALEGLKSLPDESVDCCVTSPPYFGLRDYGMAGQMGLEATPESYVAKMVELFREVRRVLKSEGTLWLNIGDSYAASGKKRTSEQAARKSKLKGSKGTQISCANQPNKIVGSLKAKDLIGIPWTLAFALRADGWYLRQDIIWNKPNPMPESVTDRCTKAHEYIFLLSKSSRYFYDGDSIRVESKDPEDDLRRLQQQATKNKSNPDDKRNGLRPRDSWNGSCFDKGKTGEMKRLGAGGVRKSGNKERKPGSMRGCPEGSGSNVCGSVPWKGMTANRRSVWTITTQPFKAAHFATFPTELPRLCIKAGCPVGGVVLDPFSGAGTTALVARELERNYIAFEINPAYIKISDQRLHESLGLYKHLG